MKAFKGRKLRQIFNLKHNCINIKSTIYFDCILHSQATAPILCDPKTRFKELNIIQTIHDFLYKTEWKRFVPRQNVNYFNYLCSRPYDHQIIFSNYFLAESWIHDIDSPYPGKNFNLGSKFDFVGKKKAEIPFVEKRRLGAEWEQVHFNVGPQLVQTSQKHHKEYS